MSKEETKKVSKSKKITAILVSFVAVGIMAGGSYALIRFNLTSLIVLPIVVGLIMLYLYFSLFFKERKIEAIVLEKEFVTLFTYFQVYLKNGYNIYNALKEISYFASPALKDDFENLLVSIDEDKSVQPYINFAHIFKPVIYEQFMISIYQMVENGPNEKYLRQFDVIFEKISSEVYRDEQLKRERKINNANVTPLLGAALLIIMITVGVVSIVGGMISGL